MGLIALWHQHLLVSPQDLKALVDQCHQSFPMVLVGLCLQANLLVLDYQLDLEIQAGLYCPCHQGHQLLQMDQRIQFGLKVRVIQ